MTDYLDAGALLRIATHLVEKDVSFGGKRVRIRELTAKQRLDANDAATAANPDAPDNALYRAMVVVAGVIDPQTKQPLLPPSAVPMLAAGREKPILALASEILKLSEALPGDLFPSNPPVDDGQPDADGGAGDRQG